MFVGYFPEAADGNLQGIGAGSFEATLKEFGGPHALSDWYIYMCICVYKYICLYAFMYVHVQIFNHIFKLL
jgi:hypothetical protein